MGTSGWTVKATTCGGGIRWRLGEGSRTGRTAAGDRQGTPASSGDEVLLTADVEDEILTAFSGEFCDEEDADEAFSSDVGLSDSGVSQGRKNVLAVVEVAAAAGGL